jgi:salicylate hydroxylase
MGRTVRRAQQPPLGNVSRRRKKDGRDRRAAVDERGWRVIIIGGGIGGLSAALSLQHHGFSVSLYEQASGLREFGAGLLVTPNAMHALNFLGVGGAIERASNQSSGHAYCHYKTAEVLQRRPSSNVHRKRYGSRTLQVHRADLHRALSAAVLAHDSACIHLDHSFIDLSQDDDGVIARFANGAVARGDALIGCDGVRSAVRDNVYGSDPVAYTGQVAFRAVAPISKVRKDVRMPGRRMYLGPGRLLLHYNLRKDTLVNIVAIAEQSEWQEEGWAIPAEISELTTLYRDFHPSALSMLRSIEPGSLFKWGLCDREPLQRWTAGRVSMLGDAAHPMSPFLGQGAVMAIEDGMILGRCFVEAASIGEALKLYEGARKGRANAAQLQSRQRGKALQGVLVESFDAKHDAEDIALFDGLFGYDPTAVSIEASADVLVGEKTP